MWAFQTFLLSFLKQINYLERFCSCTWPKTELKKTNYFIANDQYEQNFGRYDLSCKPQWIFKCSLSSSLNDNIFCNLQERLFHLDACYPDRKKINQTLLFSVRSEVEFNSTGP